MTYKTKLDQLMLVSVQKSNAFIDVVIQEGQSNSARYREARAAWELAEREYVTFLKLMEAGAFKPGDRVRSSRIRIALRLKDMAAIFF